MGMTLPLLVRAMVRDVRTASRTVGILYGVNTLGAAVGALITPWVLIRHLGIAGAVLVGVGCNVLVGIGVLVIGLARDDRRRDPAGPSGERTRTGAGRARGSTAGGPFGSGSRSTR